MLGPVNRLNSPLSGVDPNQSPPPACSFFERYVLPPLQPLKKLGAYLWNVIKGGASYLYEFFQKIFFSSSDVLNPDPQTFKTLMHDFDQSLAGYETALLGMQADAKTLVIETEKQLSVFKGIHDEKERNLSLFCYFEKGYTLTETEKNSVQQLKESCKGITALLQTQVSASLEPIKKILSDIQGDFQAKGLDSPDVSLHDLQTYLDYQNCLQQYSFPKNEAFAEEVKSALQRKKLSPLSPSQSINMPSGMGNIGNSCYIASTVQVLLASPVLMARLLAPLTKKEIETEEHFAEREAIQQALKELVLALKANNSGVISTALEKFREAFFSNKTLNRQLSIWKSDGITRKSPSPLTQQHDAAELMMLLFEVIDYHVDIQEDWWVEGQPRPDTPIMQPNQLVDIEITGEKTLQTLVDESFRKRERFDVENARKIEKEGTILGTFDKWSEQLKLNNRPEVIVLHLKRFTMNYYGSTEKITTPVVLPEDLRIDLSGAFSEPLEKRDVYHLVGTVRHTGWLGGGHYIAHVDREGLIECNDSRVSGLTMKDWGRDSEFQNYLLIFERCTN